MPKSREIEWGIFAATLTDFRKSTTLWPGFSFYCPKSLFRMGRKNCESSLSSFSLLKTQELQNWFGSSCDKQSIGRRFL